MEIGVGVRVEMEMEAEIGVRVRVEVEVGKVKWREMGLEVREGLDPERQVGPMGGWNSMLQAIEGYQAMRSLPLRTEFELDVENEVGGRP